LPLKPPPVPAWDAFHPLVVHFPIALLIVVPIFVLVGVVLGAKGRAWLWSAFVLMLLGTAGAWVSAASGAAAMELAITDSTSQKVLERHQDLAHDVRAAFTVLLGVYALILMVPKIRRKELGPKATAVIHLAYLIPYAIGLLLLANVGDLGGRLVHEYGIHALL
jgi:uncharacterized membrane protein